MHVVVRGRVQGVGFREFVRHKASNLGVVGEVWNNSFGQVEAEIFHEQSRVISELLLALAGGPGEVDGVSSTPSMVAQSCADFRVTHTRA
jgi:acylphosphatase